MMRYSMLTGVAVAAAILSGSFFIPTAFSAEEFVVEQKKDQWLASNLIGTAVKNAAGETVGDINDLVFNSDNDVDAAVIGVGGFLGIGEKDVAVTFSTLNIKRDADGNRVVIVSLDKEALEAAPVYKTLENPEGGTTAQIKEKASELGEDVKDTSKKVTEKAKESYSDMKDSMTDEKSKNKSKY